MEEELQHFSHRHPLYLTCPDGSVAVDLRYHYCRLCGEELSSGTPYYGCKDHECYYFYLHKSCAELPEELQHPSHLKHPLTLKHNTMKSIRDQCGGCRRNDPSYGYICSFCGFKLCIKCASLPPDKTAEIHDHQLTLMRKLSQFICDYCEKEGNGMFYLCSACSFMVHLECTLSPLIVRPPIIEVEIHDHPLTLARKLILFTCDACGKDGRGMFYFCARCSFVVHLDCASSPSVVKVIRHDHPLKLIYSLPAINTSIRNVCQLCVNKVDIDYWVYYCSICDFVAHPQCATSKEEKDETFVWKSKDDESIEDQLVVDESIDLLKYIVKKTKLGVDGIEIDAEIKYFSHEHDLKLTDELGINKKCDACMRYIIIPPFYACAKCALFLHKSCVELLPRIRHPLHRHPLMLLPRAPYPNSTFGCDACDRKNCDGFTYNCETCQFDLDVQCSSIPYKLTHPSHEHPLILSRSPEGRKCNHCNSSEEIQLCCADCEFALDFKCVTLPQTIRYEQHEHLFKLCYVLEDDSGEYYCDICEEERDSKFWFYYCADCIYPAHLECILKSLPGLWE